MVIRIYPDVVENQVHQFFENNYFLHAFTIIYSILTFAQFLNPKNHEFCDCILDVHNLLLNDVQINLPSGPLCCDIIVLVLSITVWIPRSARWSLQFNTVFNTPFFQLFSVNFLSSSHCKTFILYLNTSGYSNLNSFSFSNVSLLSFMKYTANILFVFAHTNMINHLFLCILNMHMIDFLFHSYQSQTLE